MSNTENARREHQNSVRQQVPLWNEVISSTHSETTGDARKLILPALNEVFDIATTRLVAVQAHPPLVIFLLLAALSLAAAWLTGYSMAEFDGPAFTHLAGYSALASLVLVMICDIEYPRFGFVRLDVPNQLIQDLESEIQKQISE